MLSKPIIYGDPNAWNWQNWIGVISSDYNWVSLAPYCGCKWYLPITAIFGTNVDAFSVSWNVLSDFSPVCWGSSSYRHGEKVERSWPGCGSSGETDGSGRTVCFEFRTRAKILVSRWKTSVFGCSGDDDTWPSCVVSTRRGTSSWLSRLKTQKPRGYRLDLAKNSIFQCCLKHFEATSQTTERSIGMKKVVWCRVTPARQSHWKCSCLRYTTTESIDSEVQWAFFGHEPSNFKCSGFVHEFMQRLFMSRAIPFGKKNMRFRL